MTYSTVERTSATQITITVRAPYPELEMLLKPAAEKISAEVEIDGFRKGHAPYEVVEQKIGKFRILEEAARFYIQKNFETILKEIESKEYKGKSFEPVGEPQVAITKLAPGQDLEYKITLSFLPPVELPDYKVIAQRVLAGKKVPEVTDEEIAASREWLRESRAKLVTVNRGAEIGDRVEIDFKTSQGGIPLEGGASENHPLILGQGKLLPGFEDKLIGMKAGEEKTFTLAIPPDYYRKSIAGRELTITATVKLVQDRAVPEWNDEFARSLGNLSSTAEVVESIRQSLALEKESEERERLRMAMVEAIARESRAEIPEPLIANELERMISELRQSIGDMGLKFEDYLAHIKKSEADLKRNWQGDAVRRVKTALILREIARREGISPSDAEVAELVHRASERQGFSAEQLKTLDAKALFDYHRGIARNEKVFEFFENLKSRI